jgi:hypothetical protein
VAEQALESEFAKMEAVAARPTVSQSPEVASPPATTLPVYNQGQEAAVAQASAVCSTPDDICSSNWAGLEAYNDAFTGISADWTVPTVVATSTSPEDSSTWIGLDGDPTYDGTANPPLVQIGTDSPSNFPGASSLYYETWVEYLPGTEQPLFYVEPGDEIQAVLLETSPDVWDVGITDVTQNEAYTQSGVQYTTPGATAEWIQEATDICPTSSTCALSQLQNFGSVSFTDWNYSASGTSALPQQDYMVDQDGNVIAYPTWDTQAITVTYGSPPTTTTTTTTTSTTSTTTTASTTTTSTTTPPTNFAGWTPVTPPSGLILGNGQNGPPMSPVSCAPGTTHCDAVLGSSSVVTGNGTVGQGVAVTSDLTDWTGYDSLPSQFVQVLSLSCPTSTQCVAVGSGVSDAPVIAVSTNGGVSWTEANVSAFAGAPGWPEAVACPSALVCYTVGGSQGPFAPMAAVSVNGGQDWTLLDKDLPAPQDYNLDGISCSSTSTCVAVGALSSIGAATSISTSSSGNSWAQSQSSTLGQLGDLESVSCPAGTTVCYGGGDLYSGGGSAVATSPDLGTSWEVLPSPATNGWVSSVSCANTLTCWATGAGTTLSLAGTGNGGSTWKADSAATTNQESNVSCASTEICVATTDNQLLSTVNNGEVTPGTPPPTTTTSTLATTTTALSSGGGGGSLAGGGGVPPAPLFTTTSSLPTTAVAATTSTTATTTTTTAAPAPRISIVTYSAAASGGYLPVKLSCRGAPCTGTAEVTGRVAVKTHKGKKTVWKNETAVLAKTPYAIEMGQTATVELKVTATGSAVFADAKAKPVRENGSATVRGGGVVTKKIRIS